MNNYLGPKVGVGVFVLNPDIEDTRFIVAKRISKDNHGNGLWSLPGGGVDYKEDPIACAKREVKEEFGIEIEEPKILIPVPYTNDIMPLSRKGEHYITLFFVAHMISGQKPEIQEEDGGKKHSEWKWVTPTEFLYEDIDLFSPLDTLCKNIQVMGFLKGFHGHC